MMTDPLSDFLTRVRNANRIERPAVDSPMSTLKRDVAKVLRDEGFVLDYEVGEMIRDEQGQNNFQPNPQAKGKNAILRVYLKYGPEGEKVMRRIERRSKPGCRVYVHSSQLAPVLDGLGIAILSTNRGVVSDRRARAERLGGELLCIVW